MRKRIPGNYKKNLRITNIDKIKLSKKDLFIMLELKFLAVNLDQMVVEF